MKNYFKLASLTLCCCCRCCHGGSRGLIRFGLLVFSGAELRAVFWIGALVIAAWLLSLLLLLLLPWLLGYRCTAGPWGGCGRGGRGGREGVVAGRGRGDGPVGLSAWALGRQVDVSVELRGLGLCVRSDGGVLPMALPLQLLGFLQLEVENTDRQTDTEMRGGVNKEQGEHRLSPFKNKLPGGTGVVR